LKYNRCAVSNPMFAQAAIDCTHHR
jgi:hypothetical protein